MQPLDYSRSFCTFHNPRPENRARIQVDSRCLLETPDGTHDLLLVTSCKSEMMYRDDKLYRDPNYDFCAFFTADGQQYRFIRTGARVDETEDEGGPITNRFEKITVHLVETKAHRAASTDEIVAATLDHKLLLGRTRFRHPSGATALVEYPIKTMNVRCQPPGYQIDTGAIGLPVDAGWDGDLMGLDLAFIVYNAPEVCELVLRRQQAVGGVPVWHYGDIRRVACESQVWVVD